jgi:hypothetical protein
MTHIAPYLASSHSNIFGTFISITIRYCFIWKIPSKVRSNMDCQKSSFSHFKMLKSESTLAVLAKGLSNPPQNIRNAPKQSAPKSSHPSFKKCGVVLVIDNCLGVGFTLVCIVECLLIFLYAVNLLNGPRLNQLGSILLKNIVNEITWFQVHKFMRHHWQGNLVSSQVIVVVLGLDTHHPIH